MNLLLLGGFIFGVLVFALLVGMFVPLLSLRSGWSLAFILGALAFAATFGWFVLAAAQGRRWALIAFLGLVTFLVDASARSQGNDAPSFDMQSMVKLMVWVGAMFIGLMHLPKTAPMLGSVRGLAVLTYGLWATASTLYSVSPAYTFGAGFAVVSFVLFGAAVVHALSEKTILITVAVSLFIFLAISLPWYFLGVGVDTSAIGVRRAVGISGSPNNLGRISTLFLLMVLLLATYRVISWKAATVLSALGAANLLLSQSRTSFIALAASAIGTRSTRQRAILGLGCVIVGVLALGVSYATPYSLETLAASLSRSGGTTEIFTLTGRTKIWAYVWTKWLESPWIGFGYASTKTFMVQEFFTAWWWTTSSAHNSILQSLVTVGIVGTVFILVAWGAQLILLLRNPHPVRDSIFLFVIVSGLTEAGAVGSTPNLLTLLWMLGVFWLDPRESVKGNAIEFSPYRTEVGCRATISTTRRVVPGTA